MEFSRSAAASPLVLLPVQQVGVALVTGKTGGAASGAGPDLMNYEAEMVTTEGGLEAVVQASRLGRWQPCRRLLLLG